MQKEEGNKIYIWFYDQVFMTQQTLGENYLRYYTSAFVQKVLLLTGRNGSWKEKAVRPGVLFWIKGGDYFLTSLNLEQTGWITKRASVLLLSKAAKFVRLGCGPKSALPTLEIPDYLYQEVRDSYAKHWAHKRRFESKGEYYTEQYCTISPNTYMFPGYLN